MTVLEHELDVTPSPKSHVQLPNAPLVVLTNVTSSRGMPTIWVSPTEPGGPPPDASVLVELP